MSFFQTTRFLPVLLSVFLWSLSLGQAQDEPCWRPPYHFPSERAYETWPRECERSRKAAEKARDAEHEQWKRDSERLREAQKRAEEQWRREEERAREAQKREAEDWKREHERDRERWKREAEH